MLHTCVFLLEIETQWRNTEKNHTGLHISTATDMKTVMLTGNSIIFNKDVAKTKVHLLTF